MADGASINAGTGTITLQAESNITIDQLTTTNNTSSAVLIDSNSGAILDADTTGINITAAGVNAQVTLNSATAMGSLANPLETNITNLVASASGAGGIFINESNAITLTNLDTAAGDIVVNAAGTITVVDVNAGTADVTLNSTGGAINSATDDGIADVIGATVNLIAAAGGIGNGSIIDVSATTALNANTTADNANIVIDSIGNLPLGLINAGSGNITLDSSGNISDGNNATNNLAGNVATLLSVTGIGDGNAIETNLTSVTATTSAAGNIELNEVDAITLTAITTNGAVGDDIIVTAGGNITVGDVDASALGNVSLTSSGGAIDSSLDNGVADVSGSTINLTADAIGTSSRVEVSATTALNADTSASNGNIVLDSIGNLPLGLVNAGSGNIDIDSTGNITDANGATNNLIGSAADLLAAGAGGIGNGNALETALASVIATTNAIGNIELNETDAITLTNITTNNGSIIVNAGTDVSVSAISSTGDITIAFGQNGAGGTANINTAVNSNNTSITGGLGNDTFNFNANVTGTSSVSVAGGNGADNFSFNGGNVATTVSGGSGNDNFIFQGGTVDAIDGNIGVDTLDYSNLGGPAAMSISAIGTTDGFQGSVTSTPAALTNTFDNIDGFIGTPNAADNLSGNNTVSSWNITGTNTGTYTTGGRTLSYSGIENLTGGSNADTFAINGGSQSGAIVGGAGNDTLSGGSDYIVAALNTGSVTGIGGGWSSIENLVGTAGADTFTVNANLSGSISGLAGADIITLADGVTVLGGIDAGAGIDEIDWSAYTTARNVVITNLDVNGADGTEASVVAFADVEIITAPGVADSLTGPNATATWNINTVNDGTLTAGGGTLTFTDFSTLSGGSATDTFNLNADVTNSINAGAGNDLFNVNTSVTACLFGNAGADSFNLLNSVNIAGGIDGGGGNDNISAPNVATTFNVTGNNAGTITTGATTTFTSIENLTGGNASDVFNISSTLAGNIIGGNGTNDYNLNAGGNVLGSIIGGIDADVFDFNGGSVIGTVDGNGGLDTLDYAGASAATTVTLTGFGVTDGFAGTAGNVGAFDDINNVIGSVGTDSLISQVNNNTVVTVATGNDTFVVNNSPTTTQILTFDSIENIATGAGDDTFNIDETHIGTLSSTGGNNSFNINSALTGNINSGIGSDVYAISDFISGSIIDTGGNNTFTFISAGNVATSITVGAGDDTFNFNAGNVSGDISAGLGNNIYDFNGGTASGVFTVTGEDLWLHVDSVRLGSSVVGDGSLTVSNEQGSSFDLTVSDAGLNLPDLTGFIGHLIIGGSLSPTTLPIDGDTEITINTQTLTVEDEIVTAGDVTLLATNIDLDNNVRAGEQVTMFAVGTGNQDGDITANGAPTIIQGNSALLVAGNNIENADNIELQLNGGDVQIVLGQGQQDPEFAVLNATSIQTTNDTDTFLNTQNISVVNPTNGVTNTVFLGDVTSGVTALQTVFASNLIGLSQLGFIDIGLFDQDLSLFGVIGQGIALALGQCEELEGCAPDITEAELEQLIAQLENRIAELELRLNDERYENQRDEIRTLLQGFLVELENFKSYQKELLEYFEAEEEAFDDDFGEDSFDNDSAFDEIAKQVRELSDILEVARRRIDWLESLKTDTQAREKLSEKTGLSLTDEMLDQIINATKEQVNYLQEQIRLLLNGTNAKANPYQFSTESSHTISQLEIYNAPVLFDIEVDLALNQIR